MLLVGATNVASIMIACSILLSFTLVGEMNSNQKVRELLSVDARAIENVGHAGLLVIFTGMYWLSGKLYCWYMVSLSIMFMFLVSGVSAACACVAVYHGREISVVSVGIVFFYFLACVVGCLTLSADVDGKYNYSIFSSVRSEFPPELLVNDQGKLAKSVRISNPTLDSSDVQQWTLWLRRCLLARVTLMAVSIVVRGIVAMIAIRNGADTVQDKSLPLVWLHTVPWTQNFVQSYTMVFHQCFILSTGFAAMMRLDDCIEMYGHGSLVFGCFDLLQGIRYVWLYAADANQEANNHGWVGVECIVSSLLHLCVLMVCVQLRKSTMVQSPIEGKPTRQWRIPRPTIFSLSSRRAKFVAFSATALAVVWQGQCVFMVRNIAEETKATTTNTFNPIFNWGMKKQIETFNQSINFGLHGAAFFLFHTVLSFQSRHAYKRLRELHVLAGMFTGVYSLTLLLHIVMFRGVDVVEQENTYDGMRSNSNVQMLLYLLALRAVVCFGYGLAFMLYSEDALDADQEKYEADMRLKYPYQHGVRMEDVLEEKEDRIQLEKNETDDATNNETTVELAMLHGETKLSRDDSDMPPTTVTPPMTQQHDQEEAHLLCATTTLEENASLTLTPPNLILAQIRKYSKLGICSVWYTGIVWSMYVIVINIKISQFSSIDTATTAISLQAPAPMVLSAHRLGYGITFHVSYLLTLFAFDGFYSGNLITLDVGRHFSTSTLVVLCSMYSIFFDIENKTINYFLVLVVLMSMGSWWIVLGSRFYSKASMFWSLDPLEGWKR